MHTNSWIRMSNLSTQIFLSNKAVKTAQMSDDSRIQKLLKFGMMYWVHPFNWYNMFGLWFLFCRMCFMNLQQWEWLVSSKDSNKSNLCVCVWNNDFHVYLLSSEDSKCVAAIFGRQKMCTGFLSKIKIIKRVPDIFRQ